MQSLQKKIILFILLPITALAVFGLLKPNQNKERVTSVETSAPTDKIPQPTKLQVSDEFQEYFEENFNFSFSYPTSLTFEKQAPLPGGTIAALGFRVDGLTESQLLSKDLKASLKSNDLYCNLDSSHGEAVCSNLEVDTYTNTKGTAGYKIRREKTFYDEESGDPIIFQDYVYAFPITEKNQSVSTYKAVVFSIKWPSEDNLKILEKIVDTVKTY